MAASPEEASNGNCSGADCSDGEITGADTPRATAVVETVPAGTKDAPLPLMAYSLVDQDWEFPLTPAPPGRTWMDATPQRFA